MADIDFSTIQNIQNISMMLANMRQERREAERQREFLTGMQDDRQLHDEQFRAGGWKHDLTEEEKIRDAYNEAQAARFDLLSPGSAMPPQPKPPLIQQPEKPVRPAGPLPIKMSPTAMPQSTGIPIPGKPVIDPPMDIPALEGAGPPVSGQEQYAPYDIGMLGSTEGLSPAAMEQFYLQNEPYMDVVMDRRFTGQDAIEAADDAALDHFSKGIEIYRTLDDAAQAAYFASATQNPPPNIDNERYIETMMRLYNAPGIGHETPEQTRRRENTELFVDAAGPIESVLTLRSYGMTPQEIAEALNKPLEEVSRIIERLPRTGGTRQPSALNISFASLSPEQVGRAYALNPSIYPDQFGDFDSDSLTQPEMHRWAEEIYEAVFNLAIGREVPLEGYSDEIVEFIELESIRVAQDLVERNDNTS